MHELLQILTKEEEVPPNADSVQKLGILQLDLVLFAAMRLKIKVFNFSNKSFRPGSQNETKKIYLHSVLNTRNELCENLFNELITFITIT